VHLFGFIIRIYHDARSSECQMQDRYLSHLTAGSTISRNCRIVRWLTIVPIFRLAKTSLTVPDDMNLKADWKGVQWQDVRTHFQERGHWSDDSRRKWIRG